jgi:23S rRNA (adenine2030-N6)-methyltransferase
MNYQHDFHAGNFADVFKHIIFACILSRLCVKLTAFRYIDTHAGGGIYDLSSPEAGRTAEWQGGIGKMLAAKPPTEVQEVVAPYLRIAAPLAGLRPPRYTGSPAIAKALLRGQDKMLFCEAHPRAFSKLKANLGTDSRAKLFEMDGYMALRAFVPPVERRGLVLIDPPYEEVGELERAAEALAQAWRKWATGIYALWYPVKEKEPVATIAPNFARWGMEKVLRLELQIDRPMPQRPLSRCGLIIVNPPFRLDDQANTLLPWLANCLGNDQQPGYRVDWLCEG